MRHFLPKASVGITVVVVTVIGLVEHVVRLHFPSNIIGQSHGMCNAQLLVQKWLHSDVNLRVLLAGEFHAFLVAAGASLLLHHNDV